MTVEEHFNEIAGEWDKKYDRAGRFQSRLAKFTHAVCSRGARGRLLDFGCGTGVLSRVFHDLGFQVSAVDISIQMLEQARLRSVPRSIDYVELAEAGDSQRLPFDDCSFDAIVSSSVLEYVPSPRDLAAELSRVIVPGGMLVFSVPNTRHWLRWVESIEIKIWPRFGGLLPLWLRKRSDYLAVSKNRLSLAEWNQVVMSAGWGPIYVHDRSDSLMVLSAIRTSSISQVLNE